MKPTSLQEEDLVARKLVLAVALASVVIVGASLAVVGWLTPSSPPAPPQRFQGEGLGMQQRAAGHARLEALEWVDRDAGIARIPIERAMDLLVARDGGAP